MTNLHTHGDLTHCQQLLGRMLPAPSADDVVEGLALSESGGFLLSRPPRKIPAGRLYAVMVSARKHRLIETVVVRAFHCVEFDLILPAKD